MVENEVVGKFGDLALEQAAINYILSGGDTMVALLGLLQPESFSDMSLRWLFQLAHSIYLEYGVSLNLDIALSDAQKRLQDPADVENEKTRIASLFESVREVGSYPPTYLIAYLSRYREARSVLQILEQTYLHFEGGDIDEGLTYFSDASISVRDRREEVIRRGEYAEGVGERFEELLDRFEYPERYQGVLTGIAPLDECVVMSAGKLGFIFGETSVGKSWLLQKFAYTGLTQLSKVLVVTTEMTKDAWERRLDAAISRVPYDTLVSGDLSLREWKSWQQSMAHVKDAYYDAGARLFVVYVPTGLTVSWLRRELKTLTQKFGGIDLVAVDYGDMMEVEKPGGSRTAARYDELRIIFAGLKGLAGEFNLPLWTISQRTREGYGTGEMGLKEIAGAIEKARIADVVLGITTTEDSGLLNLLVLKNREGRAGASIPLAVDFRIGEIRALTQEFMSPQATYDRALSKDKERRKE